ncbi:MAG: tetratricopeptide repeat protein [Minicystis sp.]
MHARLALLLAASLLVTAPALAGPGGDRSDPRVAARALAEHGHALYEAGKYAEAIDVFQQADKLFHAPTIVLALARAHAASGKLVQARALYQRVADEKLAVGSPAAFVEAQRVAREQIAALDGRIPALQILVRGGGGRGLRVTLDDAEVEGYRPDRSLPVDPGAHRITVIPSGGVGVSRTVDLREGARAVVEIELPGAGPIVTRQPLPPSPAPRPWLVPALMGFGVGAVGLGLGIGAGVVTLNRAAALRARCPGHVCAPSAQNRSDISAANGMAAASTVGFVLSGVGVATGVVLLAVKPGAPAKARAAIDVGPGSIGVSGVF